MKKLSVIIMCAGLLLLLGCGKEKEELPSFEEYHQIHSEDLKISCVTCHVADKYSAEELYLNKYKIENKVTVGEIPGVVDKNACIGCHKSGSIGPEFYGEIER